MTTPVPNQGPPLIILTKLPPPARVLPLLTPLWWAQDLQQLEEKLLNVLEWLFPFAAFIAETYINWAKEGVLGAFRAALSISMIHKSSKWCIGIQFPNREQSLNDIIWKKVEKVAQLQLVKHHCSFPHTGHPSHYAYKIHQKPPPHVPSYPSIQSSFPFDSQ